MPTFLPFAASARFALRVRKSSGTENGKRSFFAHAKIIKKLWENCNSALELGKRDGKVPQHSWTNFVNNPQPPNQNWCDIMFWKRRTTNGDRRHRPPRYVVGTSAQ